MKSKFKKGEYVKLIKPNCLGREGEKYGDLMIITEVKGNGSVGYNAQNIIQQTTHNFAYAEWEFTKMPQEKARKIALLKTI